VATVLAKTRSRHANGRLFNENFPFRELESCRARVFTYRGRGAESKSQKIALVYSPVLCSIFPQPSIIIVSYGTTGRVQGSCFAQRKLSVVVTSQN